MQINLIPDSSASSAPAGFAAMVQTAADIYEQDFPGNYTVNITYGWGTLDNQTAPDLTNPNSGAFSEGAFGNGSFVSYATLTSWLSGDAAVASLPASYTEIQANPNKFLVSNSQEKALGEFNGSSSTVDGSIGFNTNDLSLAPVAYWEEAALEEIGHALGWSTGYAAQNGAPSVLDLFRYGSAGNYQWTGGQAAYFSIDGGNTDLANFLTAGDYTLFSNANDSLGDNDPFALPFNANSSTATLTTLDIEILNILGFGLPDIVSEAAPASITAVAGTSTPIGSVTITDSGAGGDTFSMVVTANTGEVVASGNGVSGSGTNSLTIEGTLSQINSALATLAYINANAGSDTVTVATNDLTNHSSATKNIGVIIQKPSPNMIDALSLPKIAGDATAIPQQYKTVGVYIGRKDAPFTIAEAAEFSQGGRSIISIFEKQAFDDPSYFTVPQADTDAAAAILAALAIGQPSGSAIYFGVDDEQSKLSATAVSAIDSYFAEIDRDFTSSAWLLANVGPFTSSPYKIGVYAPGIVLSSVQQESLSDSNSDIDYYWADPNLGGTFSGAQIKRDENFPQSAVSVEGFGLDTNTTSSSSYFGQWNSSSSPSFPQNPGNNDEWIMSGGHWQASAEPGSHPSGYTVAAVGNITDYTDTDSILWNNASTGDVDEWKISYGAWNGSVDLGSHPGNYQIAGMGDFTGNGTDDVLWTSSSNGQVQTDIWELSNGQWAASVSPGSHPDGYQIAGIGDWTGDGTDGLLWYNSGTGDADEWQLSNGEWAASVDLGLHPTNGTDGASYQISGTGDFFDNGRDGVLWTSVNSDGSVATDIWELGSNGKWQASVSPGNHPAGYSVVGVGDFTGTGKSDILWYSASTGDADEWLINNGQWAASVDLGTHPGNFQIAGVGDFTGNGTKDILWHSPS